MSQSFFEEEAVPGFRSRESKKKFTTTVVIIAVAYFLLQMIVPFVLVFGILITQGFSTLSHMELARPDLSCYHDGRVWYLSTEGGINGSQSTRLFSFDPSQELPSEAGPTVPNDELYPLSGSDRLWLISPNTVCYLQNEELTTILLEDFFEETSTPFIHEGAPAFIGYLHDKYELFHLVDDKWEAVLDLEIPMENLEDDDDVPLSIYYDLYDLRPITVNGQPHLFGDLDDTLVHLPNCFAPEQKTGASKFEVCPIGWTWSAIDVGGKATVISKEEDSNYNTKLVARQFVNGAWTETYRAKLDFSADFGAVPIPDSDQFLLLVSELGGLKVTTVENGEVVSKFAAQRGADLTPNIMLISMIPYPFMIIFGLLFVGSVTMLMRSNRQPFYPGPLPNVRFATLWGRTWATMLDMLLAYLGLIAIMGFILSSPDAMELIEDVVENPEENQVAWLYVGLSFVWMFFVFMLTCVTQGIWGTSFGKFICGIRVVGLDLKPCGIWRAFLRNILLIVDQFCNGMVAGLLIALNPNWQRSGDLASRTIVVATGEWQTELALKRQDSQVDFY